MKRNQFRVGVSVEHIRQWGREICRGIAAYAQEHRSWSITLFERGMPTSAVLKGFDGFLWCVTKSSDAQKLTANGAPVVNLIDGYRFKGTIPVVGDAEKCGRMAARFFLKRRFRYLAFCGWGGLYFSDAREKYFRDELRRNDCDCIVYRSTGRNAAPDVEYSFLDDKLVLPGDADEIAAWVKELPKPIGVFCASDYRSWHLCEICTRLGIAVPKEVAILGVDNDPIPALMTAPTLSSIDKDTYRNGYAAAQILDDLMSGRRSKGETAPVLIPPRAIVARESTAVYPVNPPWLADALEFIHCNVARSITAVEVAERVALSYSTVENTFRKVLCTTVQKEIMSSRMEVAEQLLLTSDSPLAEIARRSGFKSPQYFTNAFNAVHKMPPSAWRSRKS